MAKQAFKRSKTKQGMGQPAVAHIDFRRLHSRLPAFSCQGDSRRTHEHEIDQQIKVAANGLTRDAEPCGQRCGIQ